jgi:uncharacterized protein (DUF4415 family)
MVTPKMRNELEQLTSMREDEIDLSDPDAPKITGWENIQKTKFYRPVKKQITIRLDADVLDWFQHQQGKYQRLINVACRDYMKQHLKHH